MKDEPNHMSRLSAATARCDMGFGALVSPSMCHPATTLLIPDVDNESYANTDIQISGIAVWVSTLVQHTTGKVKADVHESSLEEEHCR